MPPCPIIIPPCPIIMPPDEIIAPNVWSDIDQDPGLSSPLPGAVFGGRVGSGSPHGESGFVNPYSNL